VEAKHGWSAKDWWPAHHLLPPFLLSPPLSPSLAQPTHLWDKVEGQWPPGLVARSPSLADRPPHGSPIKGCQGEPPPSSQMLITNLKFPESFSKILATEVSVRVLVFGVESRNFFLLASSLASSLHNPLFSSTRSANANANT
jgi:hypothetical protein